MLSSRCIESFLSLVDADCDHDPARSEARRHIIAFSSFMEGSTCLLHDVAVLPGASMRTCSLYKVFLSAST